MGDHRLFVAIDFPENVISGAVELQNRLKDHLEGVKWTPPEKMHLTLKFLGDVPEEKREEVVDILRASGTSFDPFSLTIAGLGQFPEHGAPRILWVGIREPEGRELVAAHRYLDERMTAVGVNREDREFHPHITIGRVKNRKNSETWKEGIAAEKEVALGTVSVTEFVLYRSELHPDGARYTALEHVSLSEE